LEAFESALVSLALGFGAGRGFLAFLDSGSGSEDFLSLDVGPVFLRLLGFALVLGSGREVRFFGGEGA
jgi:hypothetical protein